MASVFDVLQLDLPRTDGGTYSGVARIPLLEAFEGGGRGRLEKGSSEPRSSPTTIRSGRIANNTFEFSDQFGCSCAGTCRLARRSLPPRSRRVWGYQAWL
jgi:hypothetical protein